MIRGDGEFVAAPSRLQECESNRCFVQGYAPGEIEIAPAPRWISDLIDRKATTPVKNPAAQGEPAARNGAASSGNFSPGKNDLDLRGTEVSLVSNYARQIGQNWQRGVDAFLNIARLCAEASARLTTAQKSKLVTSLPFGEATFSKFVKIGTDTRLKRSEIQKLLPPHYTTMYAITLLTDQQLSRAIGDKVIQPGMKRGELQQWCNAHRELRALSPKTAASDPSVASSPNASTQEAAEIGVSTFASSQHEIQDKPAVHDARAPGPLSPEEVSQPLPDVAQSTAIGEAAGASTPLPSEGEIPAFLDRRPLSPDNKRALDMIKAKWASHVQPLFNGAAGVVRERFIAFIRADNSLQ